MILCKKPQRSAPKTVCLTLEDDEETRCANPPTHGSPPERCAVHHKQYCTLTKQYKDASKIVDEIKGESDLPTSADIQTYLDFRPTLDKAQWMRRYIEAIRVEKTGREIHHRRFFLKVDDGHKIRIKVLAKIMVEAIEILTSIQTQAWDLHIQQDPAQEWIKQFQAVPRPPLNLGVDSILGSFKSGTKTFESSDHSPKKPPQKDSRPSESPSTSSQDPDADLIALAILSEKAYYLDAFRYILDYKEMLQSMGLKGSPDPDVARVAMVQQAAMLQYARRVVFYDPVLSLKALDKVSLKDLILDPDFRLEDCLRFLKLWEERLGFGLMWWKDATLEALAMHPRSRTGTGHAENRGAANFGDIKNRFHILGGWIYNRAHTGNVPDEAWWLIINILEPPANVENRFVRLCNSFDDLHGFLSFVAFGMVDPPTFSDKADIDGEDSCASRKHLSLCGVIVADMVTPGLNIGPIPTGIPASKPGCVTWMQTKSRPYIFGAIRNEPNEFTTKFLDELRARPDLFLVVTRSDTDPGKEITMFGGPPGKVPYQVLHRTFEAPRGTPWNVPSAQGGWTVLRSAADIFYAPIPAPGKIGVGGYLTNPKKYLFNFKKFPVKYIAIVDVKPGRPVRHLSRAVAWAAIRAQGYGTGDYEDKKYYRASDDLFEKHVKERFAWAPKSFGNMGMTRMADVLC